MSRARAAWLCTALALGLGVGCGTDEGGGDPAVASVSVAPPSASILVDATTQLVATPRDAQGNPLGGRSITWSSDNSGIASVNGSGLVMGEAQGNTTIRATSEGQTGTSQITVTTTPPPVASVEVEPPAASVSVSGTTQLTATAYDALGNALPGRPITWMSDNPGIASVNAGLVRGEAVGNTTVRASSEGQSGSSDITVTGGSGNNLAMRFFANNFTDLGRVKIPLDNPNRPVDVGGTFTIEFWVRGRIQDNGEGAVACGVGSDAWIEGNILLDRDRFTAPRDYGLAFLAGRVAFGVRNAADEAYTICGATNILDDAWHHVAVTRNTATGALVIFIDGVSDANATGPTGDVSYPDGASCPAGCNDPFLVIGAEKHDVGPAYPGFNGFIDELRISTSIRYPGTTTFPRPSARFNVDGNTAALYHFDEGSGTVLIDAVGQSNGEVRVGGGPPTGPIWVTSTAPTN